MERQTTSRFYESFDDIESLICAHKFVPGTKKKCTRGGKYDMLYE
jgi:hypothetical protein